MAVENVLLWAGEQSVDELYEPVMSLVLHGLDPGSAPAVSILTNAPRSN
jgi:hypothetical protein